VREGKKEIEKRRREREGEKRNIDNEAQREKDEKKEK
jgi:hypothetical protein